MNIHSYSTLVFTDGSVTNVSAKCAHHIPGIQLHFSGDLSSTILSFMAEFYFRNHKGHKFTSVWVHFIIILLLYSKDTFPAKWWQKRVSEYILCVLVCYVLLYLYINMVCYNNNVNVISHNAVYYLYENHISRVLLFLGVAVLSAGIKKTTPRLTSHLREKGR